MNQRTLTFREVRERCEVCQNLDSNRHSDGSEIVGENIVFQHRNEDGLIDFERCDLHFSDEECEEFEGWERV